MLRLVAQGPLFKQRRDRFEESQPHRRRFAVPLDRQFLGPLAGLSRRVISEAFDELLCGAQIVFVCHVFPDRRWDPFSVSVVEI